ncbi:MAG: hypothetical protein HYY04_04465 [Chloroflexi bacterium]|nr:hypothetical protein [Chloroflexota bacterium]
MTTAQLRAARAHYLLGLAEQPADQWHGFYRARRESGNYGYRFQVAFTAYALAAIARRIPDERPRITRALRLLIERMGDFRSWGYWAGWPSSPLHRENVQYSGHLACMLAAYQALDPADESSEGGATPVRATLRDAEGRLTSHSTDFDSLRASLARQMGASRSGGIACESGCIFPTCNDHALIALAAGDPPKVPEASGGDRWLAFLQRRLVVPAGTWWPRGIIRLVYMEPHDLAIPVSLAFTDAWTLAFLSPVAPGLVRELAPRLWRQLRRDRHGLFLGAPPLFDRLEIANAALATGFAYVLARELGEITIAEGLHRWADARLRPLAGNGVALYNMAPQPYVTALFALGEAIEAGELRAIFDVRGTDPQGWAGMVVGGGNGPHPPTAVPEPGPNTGGRGEVRGRGPTPSPSDQRKSRRDIGTGSGTAARG